MFSSSLSTENMAAAAPEGGNSDVFNCTICLERFKKPKYLPCLHTFCESCLNTYIVSTQTRTYTPECFPCPVCRQDVKSPDPKAPIEDWAKLIPMNHMIYSLLDNSAIAKDGTETKCSPCERDEENSTAFFWCVECRESLCDSCKIHHKRNKMSSTHQVVPLSETDKSERAIHVPDIEEPCPVHKGEILKVFCQDHQEMCCVICISIKHRRCEDIKTFDQMAESMEEGKGHLVSKIKEIGSEVKSLIDQKQHNLDKIQTQKQNILEETSSLVQQAIHNLEKTHEEFKIRLSQTHKEQSTMLVNAKERIEIFQKTLLNCEKMMKAVLEHGSPKQIFITFEKIKKQLKIQSDALKEFLKDDHDVEFGVKMDERVKEVASITSLAEIQLKSKPSVGLPIPSLDIIAVFSSRDESTELQRQLRAANIADVGGVKLWNVNTKGSWFTGGAFLDNGRLLCTNHVKNSLDVFDKDGNLEVSHSLDYSPWDLSQHSDGRIFVTDQTTGSIRIYTMQSKTFIELKTIKLEFNLDGINIVNEIIVAIKGSLIQVFTLEGKLIRKIGTSGSNRYVATSEQKSMFYYCEKGQVICMTVDGKENQRFKLANIKDARGISLDCAGNIYVCGKSSKNVVIVSEDFKSCHNFLQVFSSPFAIRFDKSGTRFFVSGWANGNLAVYDLCTKK